VDTFVQLHADRRPDDQVSKVGQAGRSRIFPNDEAIIRLVGALMLETNDEWAVAQRYVNLETLARVTDNPPVRLPAVAA
jgi:hypothetical protein